MTAQPPVAAKETTVGPEQSGTTTGDEPSEMRLEIAAAELPPDPRAHPLSPEVGLAHDAAMLDPVVNAAIANSRALK
jgi:hypothetical protein